ncbi:xanthine dehydrogenase accessory protein XdhC [Uliginosibacterium paludis]|uniref:Xanthine dehydrogenase accessory protein XdhC n=1 Tax=Uliginosibacterium paludis TaxID=1615952 RepID=A0ABV2CQT2_9RHOO
MNWLAAIPLRLAQGPLVLVTVAGVRGSAPREAGASMLVGPDFVEDTIGGGHLEWEAIAEARARLLTAHLTPALRHFPLAASLGQCCGGVVWLAFETLLPEDLTVWQQRAASNADGIPSTRRLSGTARCCEWSGEEQPGRLQLPAAGSEHDWQMLQPVRPPTFCLSVHGAGHVGRALVQILAPLAIRLRWCDARAELLADAPAGVECVGESDPLEAVMGAPAGSSHVVLTHDHALDLALSEAILTRGDFHWFGLIGSQSKRTRFRQELARRGFTPGQIARMQTPIGIEGIRDKAPQAIAIAVAAQILQQRERALAALRDTATCPRHSG